MAENAPIHRRDLLRSATTAGLVAAIGTGAADPPQKKAEPRPEDVGSIDGILAAIYDVISGPKGRDRDWGRMRGLFAPDARLIPCRPKGEDGRASIRMMGVEDYITRLGPNLKEYGFVERQVTHRVDRFGHMAQVLSTYETRLDGAAALQGRGINMVHLLWDEMRWWVVTIMWDAESPTQPIPAEYDAKR